MPRLRTYLTIVSAIVFPLVVLLWVRSYLYNDTVFRIGSASALMVDSIRGEVAAWAGPIRPRRGVIYQRETVESDYGLRTSDMLRLVPTSMHVGALGFEYAEMDDPPLGWRNATGTVRCVSLPMWFLALLTGLLPARCIMSTMHWTTASAAGRCRGCRFLLSSHHLRCPECGLDVTDVTGADAPQQDTSGQDAPTQDAPRQDLAQPPAAEPASASPETPAPAPTILIKDPRVVAPPAGRKLQWDVYITGDRRRRRDLV